MNKLKQLFSTLASIRESSRGFTMIELLVVIAVIGVLAVAVLSSINPIEQINKGRDTRTRSDAAQLINAVDRYYAIHEKYPWNVAATGYEPRPDLLDAPDAVYTYEGNLPGATPAAADGTLFGWTQTLVTTGEVKEGFVNRLGNDNSISIFKAGVNNATMYACFVPTSLAFKQEAWDNCSSGVTPQEGDTGYADGAIETCDADADFTGPFDPAAENFICLP
jgi:prepilin-type N-terminal cleavage/methylation domain-containing protein